MPPFLRRKLTQPSQPANRPVHQQRQRLPKTRSGGNFQKNSQGYVLVLTVVLGSAMMILGLTAAMFVQTDRFISEERKEKGQTLAVTESGAERLMLQLSQHRNSLLLARNYDPVNPDTGKAYLGADGVPNSNDEIATALDEWTSYAPANYPCFQQSGVGNPQTISALLSGTLPDGSSYRLLAYRYNPYKQTGYLLVQGTQAGKVTTLAISLQVAPELTIFPGIAVQRDYSAGMSGWAKVVTRGRAISGTHANIYFPYDSSGNPGVSQTVARMNASANPTPRPDFLESIWADPGLDGATTDNISGQLIACNPDFRDYVYEDEFGPDPDTLNNLGTLDTTTILTGVAGTITAYQYDRINLTGDETLTVDTTAGPVFIYLTHPPAARSNAISLYDNAKIVNIRSDGKPPRVGDLRLLATGNNSGGGVRVRLYGKSCIENAHAFMPYGDLILMTTAGGCPTSPNMNAVGVFWMESLLSAKNNPSNRSQAYQGHTQHDTLVIPGNTSGIRVPEDISSLHDVLRFVRIPWRYRFGKIQTWQEVKL
jgi:hypothetical protein